MTREELATNRLFDISFERGCVVYKRHGTNEDKPGEMFEIWGELHPILSDYAGAPLIVDIRDAKGRNDDAFENAAKKMTQALMMAFPKIVFLVRTQVGVLQVQRINKERDKVVVTTDEEEAYRLAGGA